MNGKTAVTSDRIYLLPFDNTLSIIPDVEAASTFLSTLNEIHPSISFTIELEKNGKLPFLGMEIIRNGTRLDRKAYRKPTDTGLLLHYHSHVHIKYKHSLLKTMLNRAFKLSSNWQFFHQECERLRVIFTRLHYPESLIQNTIKVFVEMKATGNTRPAQQLGEIPVRIPLPFKDQRSANKLREQLRARLHGEFQPGLKFQRAEISARLLKQILLKSNCRLHGDFFSPG